MKMIPIEQRTTLTTAQCAECEDLIYCRIALDEVRCSCGKTLLAGGPDSPYVRWNTAAPPIIKQTTLNKTPEMIHQEWLNSRGDP